MTPWPGGNRRRPSGSRPSQAPQRTAPNRRFATIKRAPTLPRRRKISPTFSPCRWPSGATNRKKRSPRITERSHRNWPARARNSPASRRGSSNLKRRSRPRSSRCAWPSRARFAYCRAAIGRTNPGRKCSRPCRPASSSPIPRAAPSAATWPTGWFQKITRSPPA